MSTQPPPPPPMPQPPMPPVPVQPQTAAAPGSGPGRKWYAIAFLLFLLIFVPSLLAFLKGLDGITNGLIRVPAPGETSVELEPGTWTVFYEHTGEFEGETITSTSQAPGMQAQVLADDGSVIPVTASGASFDYNIGGHAGYSIGEFAIAEAGTYTFQVNLVDPDDPERYVLALGEDLGRSTVALALGVTGMIGGAFIAFVVWLIVIILRSRAKKKQQMAGYAT